MGEDLKEFEVLCQTRTNKVVKEGESKWLNNSFETESLLREVQGSEGYGL
jgi:hypothetical protein